MPSVTATTMLPLARQVFEVGLQAALQSLGSCIQPPYPWEKLGHKCQESAWCTVQAWGQVYINEPAYVCVPSSWMVAKELREMHTQHIAQINLGGFPSRQESSAHKRCSSKLHLLYQANNSLFETKTK